MPSFTNVLCVASLVAILAACRGEAPTPSLLSPTPTARRSPNPTATRTTVHASPTLLHAQPPQPQPTTPFLTPPPSGLAYCLDRRTPGMRLQLIGGDGAATEVSPFCTIQLSSDRSRAFFPRSHDISIVDFSTGTVTSYVDSDYGHACAWSPSEEGILFSQSEDRFTPDIWSLDLASGRLHNLTNTPSRVENCPAYWPSEDVYLFGSHDRDPTGIFHHSSGFPTTMSLDGSRYTVLTENLRIRQPRHISLRRRGSLPWRSARY